MITIRGSPIPTNPGYGRSYTVLVICPRRLFRASSQLFNDAWLRLTAWLMAQSSLREQKWKPEAGSISGVPEDPATGTAFKVQLKAPAGLDLGQARIVWDAADHAASFGREFAFTPKQPGPQWIEVEAQWPDGKRVFGVMNFTAR